MPVLNVDDEANDTEKWNPGTSTALDELFITLLFNESLALDLYGSGNPRWVKRSNSSGNYYYNPLGAMVGWGYRQITYSMLRRVNYPSFYNPNHAGLWTTGFYSFAFELQIDQIEFELEASGGEINIAYDPEMILAGLNDSSVAPVHTSPYDLETRSFGALLGVVGQELNLTNQTGGVITKEYRELPLADSVYNYSFALALLMLVRIRRCNSCDDVEPY